MAKDTVTNDYKVVTDVTTVFIANINKTNSGNLSNKKIYLPISHIVAIIVVYCFVYRPFLATIYVFRWGLIYP